MSQVILVEPQKFSNVIGIPEWDMAMVEEYYLLMKNHT